MRLQPSLVSRLGRFSDERAEMISGLSKPIRQNLAIQKETLTAAMKIAGIDTEEVLQWSPGQGPGRSFLEGLSKVYVREDAAIAADFADVPGFAAIGRLNLPVAARVFQNTSHPHVRLKVIMTNRLPLEQQTGADLIYYNEAFRSFVMVQYKMMEERPAKGVFRADWEFRWRDGDQFADEISRMDDLLRTMRGVTPDNSPVSFRLHENPFFLKLSPRIDFDPDAKGLSSGMYLPLELWRSLAADPSTLGPQGGRVIKFNEAQRRFNNTEFIQLVSGAWVGTTVPQSVILERVIEIVVQTGRTVTLAVKSAPETTEQADAEISGVGSPKDDLADLL